MTNLQWIAHVRHSFALSLHPSADGYWRGYDDCLNDLEHFTISGTFENERHFQNLKPTPEVEKQLDQIIASSA